jgi:hypothetical protein
MRFMVIMKASPESEAGQMPSEKLLAEMGAYNERLVEAGVMVTGEGLHPSSNGARIRFAPGGTTTVIDGPFAETKELVAGFWIFNVASREEAIEWARGCPNTEDGEFEIEVRRIFEMEDFGDEFTPELREQEERLREQAAQNG